MSASDQKAGDNCRFSGRCPMYPAFKSEAALQIYKMVYCHNAVRFRTCARYKLASRGTMPAPDLLPDGGRLPAHWIESDSEADEPLNRSSG